MKEVRITRRDLFAASGACAVSAAMSGCATDTLIGKDS